MSAHVPRMDEREARAWLALIGTAQLLPAALDAQLQAQAGMTHFEFIVLSALRRSPEGMLGMSQLAAVTAATLPRLSKVVQKLIGRGLVERRTDVADRRAVNLTLTSAGRRALVRATPGHIALARHLVIDALTPAQLDALADALEPVVAALDPHRSVQRIAGGD
nr:MarR family winged helix-turn-helix transcriptional regulator [Microbacterium bovistercoris]